MIQKISLALTARTFVRRGDTAKVKFVTDTVIRCGDTIIARSHLGGRFSPEQALMEFRRNPGHFQKADAFATYEAANAAGLVA